LLVYFSNLAGEKASP